MKRPFVLAVLAAAVAIALAALALMPGGDQPRQVAAVGSGGTAPGSDARALAVGQVANFTLASEPKPTPEISFNGGDWRDYTLADFRGKVVLLNFWATWCAPCVREMPSLARLQAAMGGDDFVVVALSGDRQGLSVVREFYEKHGIGRLGIYVDPTTSAHRKFGVVGLPTTVVLDREGREVGRLVGPAEWDSPEAQALLRRFIARAPAGSAAPAASGS